MFSTRNRLVVSLLVGTLALGACDSGGTGPDNGSTSETRVVLSGGTSASTALLPALSIGGASFAAGPVTLGSVSSIDVTITGVQALPVTGDTANEAEWVSLDVAAPTRVNLIALPTTVESGIQLARGTLLAGTYGNLRLRYSDATITFSRDVTIPGGGAEGTTYVANTAYPLEIGGGTQTGIRIPTAGFTVADSVGATVAVSFDAGTSVKKVIATPKGVRMVPAMTAKRD